MTLHLGHAAPVASQGDIDTNAGGEDIDRRGGRWCSLLTGRDVLVNPNRWCIDSVTHSLYLLWYSLPPSSQTMAPWCHSPNERAHLQSHSPCAPLWVRGHSLESGHMRREVTESGEEVVVEDEHTSIHWEWCCGASQSACHHHPNVFACQPPAVTDMTRGQHGHFPFAAFYDQMQSYVGVVMLTLTHSSAKVNHLRALSSCQRVRFATLGCLCECTLLWPVSLSCCHHPGAQLNLDSHWPSWVR